MKKDKLIGAAGDFSGMITVEMAYIIPVILSVFFMSVLGIFYYHDKEVIASCAYEAAVVGSTKAREKDGVTEETVEAIFDERVQGKCILFGKVQASVEVSGERIAVSAFASKRRMQVSITETASITGPEEKIRKHRRLIR